MQKILGILMFSACLAAVPEGDGGATKPTCERRFSGAEVNSEMARLLDPYRIDGGHPACPGPNCDSTVALPWCGPFQSGTDGGTDYVGGLFVSADESVIRLSTWRGELFFGSPQVEDPRVVALQQAAAAVTVPAMVGPFKVFPTGLGMTSATGTAVPPQVCGYPNQLAASHQDWRSVEILLAPRRKRGLVVLRSD